VSSNGDTGLRSGGHQFMRTAHASLKREPPRAHRGPKIGPYSATVELVPLSGARPHTYDVCARWVHPVNGSVGTSRMIVGDETAAWLYFHELVDVLKDPGVEDERLRRAIGDG
jgi:hypothetical protein